MSLKAFHIFFIIASILLCLGLGIWGMGAAKNSSPFVMGMTGFAAAAGLPFYLFWFLGKSRK